MLRHKLRILGIAALFILTLCGGVIALTSLHQVTEAGRSEVKVGQLHDLTELRLTVRKMQYDIVQVQQFLTDFSATRGQSGLDDGLKQAAAAAVDFRARMQTARATAARQGLSDVAARLGAVEAAFPAYYATGQLMAHTYANDGTEAGNRFMPRFDPADDGIVEAQEPLLKAIAAQAETLL